MQDIADATGYSLMTVSRVIRGTGSASANAREAIEASAEELGYQHNPEVTRLMSLMRSGKRDQYVETLGLVWFVSPQQRKQHELLVKLEQGMEARAEKLGFRLDPMEFRDYRKQPRRLFDVLYHRGVRGVILTPILGAGARALRDLDAPWDDFAWVAFGNTHDNQEFHRVGHHHFFGMELALQHLSRLGHTRPALYISDSLSYTVHHAYTGSFFANHPLGAEAAVDMKIPSGLDLGEMAGWCRRHQADVILSPHCEALSRLRGLPTLVSLHVKKEPRISGIDQQNHTLGTYAVDMLVAQLHRDERGLPAEPKLMMNKGSWRELS